MARKKQSLGEFRVGRYVKYTRYSIGASISHYYGRVVRVDVDRSVVIWLPLGRESPVETQYPPPAPGEPSSWKFGVIRKRDIP